MTLSKARQGADGIGVTRARKGMKVMLLVEPEVLPGASYDAQAGAYQSHALQGLFDFMVTGDTPTWLIGDKAYGSDPLDAALSERNIEIIAHHRSDRRTVCKMAVRCVAQNVFGPSNVPLTGCRTCAGYASTGRSLPACFRGFSV